MKAIQLYKKGSNQLSKLNDVSILAIRLVLAYGFYGPASMKWGNVSGIAEWFASMNIPFPTLNAYLATGTEMAAVFLLPIGLATRIISIPLVITMIVAIFTVHIGNGFQASENGFEIPLYYLIMLSILLTNGAGKFSLDYFIKKRK